MPKTVHSKKSHNGHSANGCIRVLDRAHAWGIFEAAAQRYLRISGREFVEKWDAGEFHPDPDARPGVMQVAALLPLVR